MKEKIDGVVLVPEPTEKYLGERQLIDYKNHRKNLIQWSLNLGKNPEKAKGYSKETMKVRTYRLDKFYRYVWQEIHGGYTTNIAPDHADRFMRYLAVNDEFSTTYNATIQKSIKMLFKWQNHERGKNIDWEPQIKFSGDNGTNQPRDFLTIEERELIREVALEVGFIPHYNSLSPSERDRWRAYLAQLHQKPKEEVDKDDWKKANDWKIPSLAWTSLDTGLRPIEVGRAKTSWVDSKNQVLRIPAEDSSKNRDNWVVALRSKTSQALDRWLEQRKRYDKYSDTEKIWLTARNQPYSSKTLGYLLEKLCKEAEIPTKDRSITWYSIRHSVGTAMTQERGLAAAQAQLRHKSENHHGVCS